MERLAKIIFAFSIFLFVVDTEAAKVRSCPEGQYLVRSHWRAGYYRSDGTKVSSARVSAYCKNYRTYKPAEIHFHHVKWRFFKRKYKNFSKQEKEQIRKSFKKIPRVLTDIGKVTFYRKDRDLMSLRNPAKTYPKSKRIIVYDSISRYAIERVIAHELAHILYGNLSKAEIKSYMVVAEWEEKEFQGESVTFTMRKNFVDSDGKYFLSEDFANNIEYYLFEEKTLRRKNPKIYKWVKQFMGGKGR